MTTVTYLDHAATTPVDPQVVAALGEVLAEGLGNPSASHAAGRRAAALIDRARLQVAALIGTDPAHLVFTSGATEANNLAIAGHAAGLSSTQRRGAQVLGLVTDHKAVLSPLRRLAEAGFVLTLLQPDAQGLLSPQVLAAALGEGAQLVSLVHVNSETGVMQDLPALAAVCRERGVALHIDAAQSAGKLPLSVDGIDYLSFTAHKLGGPQGIGALYVAPQRRVALQAQIVGGGQQRGLRSGTLPTHQIVAFGLACQLAADRQPELAGRLSGLRQRLWQGLADLPGVLHNGHPQHCAPGILNLSFTGVEGESLVDGLSELAVSTGSACNSSSGEPSPVLRALGRDTQLAQASLRLRLGQTSTAADVDVAIAAIRRELSRLRALSPDLPPPVADWQAAGWAVAQGEGGERRLGTWVRCLLALDGPVIRAARFQVYGCPQTLSVCQQLAGRLPGLPLAHAEVGSPQQWLETVAAPVEKLGRMLIIEDALRAAQSSALQPFAAAGV